MQYYDFQPDLTKKYLILSETKLIFTDNVDPNMVQDTIIKNLLPKPFSMLGTKVKLSLVTVIISHNIAYWDLIFEYPKDYEHLNIFEAIFNNSIELDDSFEHTQCGGEGIYKISFMVG